MIGKATENSSHIFTPEPVDEPINFTSPQAWQYLDSVQNLIPRSESRYKTGETWHNVVAQVLTSGETTSFDPDKNQFTAWHFQYLLFLSLRGLRKLGKELEDVVREWTIEEENVQDFLRKRPLSDVKSAEIYSFCSAIAKKATGRRGFRTAEEDLGLGPHCLQAGDLVCILFGGCTPYILRPSGDRYRFVGECYLHEYMYGEGSKDGLMEKQTFEIF